VLLYQIGQLQQQALALRRHHVAPRGAAEGLARAGHGGIDVGRVAVGTCAMVWPVAGSKTANVSPDAAWRHWPSISMSLRMGWGCCSGAFTRVSCRCPWRTEGSNAVARWLVCACIVLVAGCTRRGSDLLHCGIGGGALLALTPLRRAHAESLVKRAAEVRRIDKAQPKATSVMLGAMPSRAANCCAARCRRLAWI
jgi:hypothetical protein